MNWCPKFSLREILFVVFFAGLGLASLQTGGWLAGFTFCFSAVLVLGFAIIAFVARDDWKAFAIGLIVPVFAYAILFVSLGEKELNPYQARLPSSRMLLTPYQAMKERAWVNMGTGEFIRYFDPKKDKLPSGVGGGFSGGGMGGFAVNAEILSDWPDSRTFMSVGHVLIAMMLGYMGGKFAIVVRRNQPVAKPASEN